MLDSQKKQMPKLDHFSLGLALLVTVVVVLAGLPSIPGIAVAHAQTGIERGSDPGVVAGPPLKPQTGEGRTFSSGKFEPMPMTPIRVVSGQEPVPLPSLPPNQAIQPPNAEELRQHQKQDEEARKQHEQLLEKFEGQMLARVPDAVRSLIQQEIEKLKLNLDEPDQRKLGAAIERIGSAIARDLLSRGTDLKINRLEGRVNLVSMIPAAVLQARLNALMAGQIRELGLTIDRSTRSDLGKSLESITSRLRNILLLTFQSK